LDGSRIDVANLSHFATLDVPIEPMQEIKILNDRSIIYQRHALDVNWAKAMPTKRWVLLVIIDGKQRSILDEISRKAIDHGPYYICCVGRQSERLHDMIDEEIGFREVDIEDHYLPDHGIMTTWDSDLNEALWFAVFAAVHDDGINTVLCLDASDEGVETIVTQFVNGGYLDRLP
jgi:hypothetical protein